MEFDLAAKMKEVERVKHASKHWKQYEREKSKRERLADSSKKLDKQSDTIVEMQTVADESHELSGAIAENLVS